MQAVEIHKRALGIELEIFVNAHTSEFIGKLLQAKMPSLIINCKEIKSDVSKRKRKQDVEFFILLCWRGREQLLSIKLRILINAGQLSAPLLPTVLLEDILYRALGGTTEFGGPSQRAQKPRSQKNLASLLGMFYNVEIKDAARVKEFCFVNTGRNIMKNMVL